MCNLNWITKIKIIFGGVFTCSLLLLFPSMFKSNSTYQTNNDNFNCFIEYLNDKINCSVKYSQDRSLENLCTVHCKIANISLKIAD